MAKIGIGVPYFSVDVGAYLGYVIFSYLNCCKGGSLVFL